MTLAAGTGGGTATRVGGSWLDDGLRVGQRVTISGLAGSWRVKTVTANVLGLEDGDMLPIAGFGSRTISVVVQTVTAGDVPVQSNVPITIAGGAFGGYVTRHDGLSWKTDGFIEGQLVRIQGIDGAWRVRKILGAAEEILRLERGAVLPTIATQTTRMVFWPGPHGGLTVLHGGGNTALRIEFEMDTAAGSVTRLDGRSWIDAGFSIGQRVQVEGDGRPRTITGFDNSACPFRDDPFPGCGLHSTMELSADVDGDVVNDATNQLRAVHVADAEGVSATAPVNVTVQPTGPLGLPTSTLTCAVAGCFAVSAPNGTVFEAGMQVRVSGHAGPWTVVSVSSDAMVLQGAALRPTYAIVNDAIVFTPISVTVSAIDADYDGGVRMGGDTIVVCNAAPLDPSKPCRGPEGTDRLAGPESPLVVYGDTSQDGVWYGGRPADVKGMEFGPKPFDPFYKVPDADNEDDEWVFPLANPYDFDGNDVIDASNLFADVSCVPGACALPTVGFTAYGGGGDDLIIGSQTGDHLAGGSGDDEILGLRGVDHIYGDSGVNVDVLTRGLTVSTMNCQPARRRSTAASRPATSTIKPVPSINADLLTAGRDELYGEGAWTYVTGTTVHAITTSRRRPAGGLRRRDLRRPRHGRAADGRSERARRAAAEDPDDDDRFDPPGRVARVRQRRRRRDLRQPRPRRADRRRGPRHGRRRRGRRHGLRRQRVPAAPCRRAAVPDRHGLHGPDRHHERSFPGAVRDAHVQPHGPPERLRVRQPGRRGHERPAARQRRVAVLPRPRQPGHRHASVVV